MPAQSRVLIFAATLLLGASAAQGAGTATLQGMDNAKGRVLIKCIDKGGLLFGPDGKLQPKAEIAPGKHTVTVMCVLPAPEGRKYIVYGDVPINAEAGKTYALTGKVSLDDMKCSVKVK
jgi:hypothetical protein